jgi:hypothetical protein
MLKRILYGSKLLDDLATAYLLGSVTLGGAFAASTPTPTPATATSSAEAPSAPATPGKTTEPTDQAEAVTLQSSAKITADQAKATALAQFPGATVNAVTLEDENGAPVYGVQLTDSVGKGQDVKVDAVTGKVLQAEADGPETSGTGAEASGTEGSDTDSTSGGTDSTGA